MNCFTRFARGVFPFEVPLFLFYCASKKPARSLAGKAEDPGDPGATNPRSCPDGEHGPNPERTPLDFARGFLATRGPRRPHFTSIEAKDDLSEVRVRLHHLVRAPHLREWDDLVDDGADRAFGEERQPALAETPDDRPLVLDGTGREA